MSSENLFINYPAVYAGTDKSEIFFMNGTPDLAELFKPGTDCGYRRFFVFLPDILCIILKHLFFHPLLLPSLSGHNKGADF